MWLAPLAGTSGQERIPFPVTRDLARAAIAGQLVQVPYETDPLSGFEIPTQCPGVDPEWLNPRNRAEDEGEYELRVNIPIRKFHFGTPPFPRVWEQR
jgi:phosphoenolpyruvate carboxykinase (ATP)